MTTLTNPQYYLKLLGTLENTPTHLEEIVLEELDALWREMTSAEKNEVDNMLGVQVGIGN